MSDKSTQPTLEEVLQSAYNAYLPELNGTPETGKWYRLVPPGCVCGGGAPYHGAIKTGSSNNLIVIFNGGGLAVGPYMAAHPIHYVPHAPEDAFYVDDVNPASDRSDQLGLGSDHPENLFRDWSIININYASGDLHTGRRDYTFTDENGAETTVYYRGYDNYRAVMAMAMPLLPQPEKLIVTGTSAGGFAAAILADDVMGLFPRCTDVTCCVDSAQLRWDWTAAVKHWNTPEEICARVHSDNIVQDCLIALHKKHGSKVRCLYTGSPKDGELAKFQSYMDGGAFRYLRAYGEVYKNALQNMIRTLRENIPGFGACLFDLPFPAAPNTGLTLHTITQGDDIRTRLPEGISVQEWLWNAVNGKTESYGLHLLGL